MADPFHELKLREGVASWNAWRTNNPAVAPELQDVQLSLSERQLLPDGGCPIDLSRARLDGSNLRHAALAGANFEDGTLAETVLANARLEDANFRRADLTNAVLDDADLARVLFDQTRVAGASLARARNLTQDQVDRCLGDHLTVLPAGLAVPLAWSRNESAMAGAVRSRGAASEQADDVYVALGVASRGQATEEEIRRAYYATAKVFHPDRNPGDEHAAEIFKTISNATAVLLDPAKHALYRLGDIDITGKQTASGRSRHRRTVLFRIMVSCFAAPLAASLAVLGVFIWIESGAISQRAPDNTSVALHAPGEHKIPLLSAKENVEVYAPAASAEAHGPLETGALAPSDGQHVPRVARSGEDRTPSVVAAVEVETIEPERAAAVVPPADLLPLSAPPAVEAVATLSGPASSQSFRGDPRRHFRTLEIIGNAAVSRDARERKRQELPPIQIVTAGKPRPAGGSAQRRAQARDEGGDIPFVAPSCKLTPACRANLEMCSC